MAIGVDRYRVLLRCDDGRLISRCNRGGGAAGELFRFIRRDVDRIALHFTFGFDTPVNGPILIGGPNGEEGRLFPANFPDRVITEYHFNIDDHGSLVATEFWYQSSLNGGDFSFVEVLCSCDKR